MTNTKLEIIGPYTPEHPGPFCTRDGKPVRLLCADRKGMPPIVGLVQDGGMELLLAAGPDGVATTMSKNYDLMNAEEVPVAREFWLVGGNVYRSQKDAEDYITAVRSSTMSRLEIIHVREVLPGDAE